MTYLEKIDKDYDDGIISLEEYHAMVDSYKSSDEKERIELQYEEYKKELVLKNYYNDVKGIRKNVQFFFWLWLIGGFLWVIVSILS